MTADGAYATRSSHAAIVARQACAVIPVRRNGWFWKETTPGAQARNETLRATRRSRRDLRKRWSGYHARCRAKNKMHDLKLLGERLIALTPDCQTAAPQIRAALLNRFTAPGTPETKRFSFSQQD